MVKRISTFILCLVLLFCVSNGTGDGSGNRVYADCPYSLSPNPASVTVGNINLISINGLTPNCILNWGSLNPEVATFANGIVTGKKPGTATVWASVQDSVTTYLLVATVYVVILDGVYMLRNNNSYMYAELYNQCILDNTDVVQMYLHAYGFPELYQVSQYWRIKYLGSGYYIFRSYQRLDYAMSNENGSIKIKPCSNDTLANVPEKMRWKIAGTTDNSVTITNTVSGSNYTLQIENNSTEFDAKCIAATGTGAASGEWTPVRIQSPPEGVLLYDSDTGINFTNRNVDMTAKSWRSLTEMKILPCKYSLSLEPGDVHTAAWQTGDASVAEVNSGGSAHALDAGTAEIQARYSSSSTTYSKYTVRVERLPKPSIQNKDNWCWVAASKMVGVHNGGNTATNNPLPEGVVSLLNSEGVHSYTNGQTLVKCYGELYYGGKTVDAGQRYLIMQIKGNDQDLTGSDDDIIDALQWASYNTMHIEKKTKSVLFGWTTALKNTFNNELNNGRYVLVSVTYTSNGDVVAHSLVVQSIDTSGGVTSYDLWDPSNGGTQPITQNDLFSNNSFYYNGIYMTLSYYMICN